MFQAAKGFRKEDLRIVLEEIGESVPPNITIAGLKELLTGSKQYKDDPNFVEEILVTTVADRKLKEQIEIENKKSEHELALARIQAEGQKLEQELELARIQAQGQSQGMLNLPVPDFNNCKRKFRLPKLEFRQFGDDLKDWLPFWSQFQHIHKDDEIAAEDKFQYLVQATVVGSRAREVVESFPPNGINYAKAIESLKARFGREDLLVEIYVRELLKLIITVQTKEAFGLTSLYDKLETYLRALETLGVTTDKCASILYPMVESCFHEDFLKAWNRSNSSSSATDSKERLNNLMNFLKTEVEGEERISMAMEGFGLTKQEDKYLKKKKSDSGIAKNKIPTAAGLLTTSYMQDMKKTCVFCDGKHLSVDCFCAQKMSLSERQKVLKEKKCCFACLVPGHPVKRCKAFIKCLMCGRRHVTLMCGTLEEQRKTNQKKEDKTTDSEINMSNFNRSTKVLLQTLKAKLISNDNEMIVRLLFDSGSQKSYILKDVAEKMKYSPLRQEKVIHSLFGGATTGECNHNCFKIRVKSLHGRFRCNFDALDQITICENVQPVGKGSWIKELEDLGIKLTDVSDTSEPIQVLIGADIMGKLLTGRREELSSGLVAMETQLGWTVMGKVSLEDACGENLAMSVTSLFVKEAEISDLWRLDLIGIKDPIEKKSKSQQDLETREHFLETVRFNAEGRYEVALPWADDKTPLPDNFNLAKKRLDCVTEKLRVGNFYQEYDEVLRGWLDEGIIEEVPEDEICSYGHYLPHRPVYKESSKSTPIRPVFDASARMKNHPSLNQCLQCGPNLLELIPDMLLRFRKKELGVIADIRKAFLQIGVRQEDRDFLRFLWWENAKEQKLKVFRHKRVVFGVKCSPFLLSSVLEYHMEKAEEFDFDFRNELKQSFYVDNVVASVHSVEDLEKFVSNSQKLLSKGGFDLRGWEHSGDNSNSKEVETHVLGMIWDKYQDTIKVNMSWIEDFSLETVTKRVILAVAHKVFDPFGFSSPVMLFPKLILQKAWKMGIGWDEEVAGDLRHEFLQWFQELKILKDINIPRFIRIPSGDTRDCEIHTFCDASQDSYAAVVFLRIKKEEHSELFLLASKSRIAPLRGGTIPRLELLAALIGARLAKSVLEAMYWKEMNSYFWSDSTAVLAWISREENWSVFVRNRVQEIRNLSSPSSWRHVPGDRNPADLPSRGCRAKQLISLKWWEGPEWLRVPAESDNIRFSTPEYKEDEIEQEKVKSVKSLADIENVSSSDWYYQYFSSYEKIVRLIGWILRFKHNCSVPTATIQGELTASEFEEAERRVIWMIQKESSLSEKDGRLKTLGTFKDERDILRLKTKIVYRKDNEEFLKPVILPSKHQVVEKLIFHIHVKNCHAGLQITLNQLREKYWVLKGRKVVRAVLSKCTICKRFNSKNIEASAAPLPEDRVKDAAVFQVTGIDMAGPLFLKDKRKSWVIIFTCSVYRAVHFELVSSASTDAFLMALRRFVARRGRCSTIYCDNGTNFVGAANTLKILDWNRIKKHGAVNSIEWKFNPPSAPWWGGWWERLIRLLKDLLKRVLGHACLSYEELVTVLADCEGVINSRPLTYIYERECLKPISPNMFLQDVHECSLPDVDAVDQKSLVRRLKYRQVLQKDLRKRFRSEYLGLLVQQGNFKRDQRALSIGDIVLVGADNKKRVNWPLGRVIELIPGKDGNVRLVKIQTSNHQLLRPVQRIYSLEVSVSKDCFDQTIPRSSSDCQKQNSPENTLEEFSTNPVEERDQNIVSKKTRTGRVIHEFQSDWAYNF